VNWDAVSAIGEIVGAVGMIVSIVYLAHQIRTNTRATRASASFNAMHSWAHTNESLSALSDEAIGWVVKLGPDVTPADLSEVEWVRLTLATRAIVQKLEGQYYLDRYGLLHDGVWEKRRGIVRGMIDLPVLRTWWEGELRQETFTDEFIAALKQGVPIDAIRINRRPA
jgi:hypothetical protein